MPFTYIVAFFPKMFRVFKKIFDFFIFFRKSPFEPVQCRARKAPSPYRCVFLQNFAKHFENFAKKFLRLSKRQKSGTPRQGVGGRAPSKIRKFAKKVVYTLDFRRLLLYNK